VIPLELRGGYPALNGIPIGYRPRDFSSTRISPKLRGGYPHSSYNTSVASVIHLESLVIPL
jgi:hypothetical protein